MHVTPIILTELFGTSFTYSFRKWSCCQYFIKRNKRPKCWLNNNYFWLRFCRFNCFALISSALGGVAHLNPAVTIMSAIANPGWGFEGISQTFIPPYALFIIVLIVQFIGALL